jgi:hypothetical protein
LRDPQLGDLAVRDVSFVSFVITPARRQFVRSCARNSALWRSTLAQTSRGYERAERRFAIVDITRRSETYAARDQRRNEGERKSERERERERGRERERRGGDDAG